jgi:hypothetical protein
MLTTPKKTPAKTDNKAVSDTASFRKVAMGFSPDEVNIYIHKLKKENIELQADVDRLTAEADTDSATRIEQLERQLREVDWKLKEAQEKTGSAGEKNAEEVKALEKRLAEAEKRASSAEKKVAKANEMYNKEKELTTMLTEECGRLGDEKENLSKQLASAGSAATAASDIETKLKAEFQAAEEEQKKLLAVAEEQIKQLKKELEAKPAVVAPPPPAPAAKAPSPPPPPPAPVAKAAPPPAPVKPAPAVAKAPVEPEIDDLLIELPVLEAPSFDDLLAEVPVIEAAKPEPAPLMTSDIDFNFDEFQIPVAELEPEPVAIEEPIFEEAVEEIIEVVETPKAKAEPAKRAELKIQIFQEEEEEESYAMPDPFSSMITDSGDEDDDFSYLLTDISPLEDIGAAEDTDDDMESFLIGPAPSSKPKSDVPRRRTDDAAAQAKKNSNSGLSAPAQSHIKMAPPRHPADAAIKQGSAMIIADDATEDDGFVNELSRRFNAPEAKGADMVARNLAHVETGEDLVAGNPHYKEKGADLTDDLYQMVGDNEGALIYEHDDVNIG